MTILRFLLVAIAVMAAALAGHGAAEDHGYVVIGTVFILIWAVWAQFLI